MYIFRHQLPYYLVTVMSVLMQCPNLLITVCFLLANLTRNIYSLRARERQTFVVL